MLRIKYEILKNLCLEALSLFRKNLIEKAQESGLGTPRLNFLKRPVGEVLGDLVEFP